MILIEIQKGTHYLKKEQQTTTDNETAKIQTDQIYMTFRPLTSSFSADLVFKKGLLQQRDLKKLGHNTGRLITIAIYWPAKKSQPADICLLAQDTKKSRHQARQQVGLLLSMHFTTSSLRLRRNDVDLSDLKHTSQTLS